MSEVKYLDNTIPYSFLARDIAPGVGSPRERSVYGSHVRVFGGLGINTVEGNEVQTAIALSALYQNTNFVLGGGFIHSNNQNYGPPYKSWNEVDALIGYAISGGDLLGLGIRPDKVFLSIASGVGYVDRQTRWRFRRRFGAPPPDSTHFNTFEWGFGFPVQIQASYSPLKFVGIGGTAYMNINKIHTNYGAAATLQIYYF